MVFLLEKVEMKSHPHPERPDRLRAIAASLATAGNHYFIFSFVFKVGNSWAGVYNLICCNVVYCFQHFIIGL